MRRTMLIAGLGVFTTLWLIIFASWYHFPYSDTFSADAGDYGSAAVHLAQSWFYSSDGVHPYFEREPGYSFFLAIIFRFFGMENAFAVFILQGLLYVLTSFYFCRELQRISNEKIAWICFVLLMSSLSVFHSIFSGYRELFALCLWMMISAIVFSFHARQSFIQSVSIGFLLGWVILTYFSFVFFPAFFLLYLYVMQVPFRHIVVMLFLPIVMIASWGVRNMSYDGRFRIIDSHRTAVMWYVRGEQAERVHGFEPFLCLWSEYISRDWTHRSSACSFNGLMHARWPENASHADDALLAAQGRQKILSSFGWYLWFSLFEILELHFPFVGGGWSHLYNIGAAFCSLILFAGCVFGFRSFLHRQYLFLHLLIVYNTFVFILTDATPRYLIPVIFCYVVCSAIGYARMVSSRS